MLNFNDSSFDLAFLIRVAKPANFCLVDEMVRSLASTLHKQFPSPLFAQI